MSQPDGLFVSSCKKPWVIALLLSVVTFALFSPAIGYDFINYDDNLYVYENAHVQHGLTWEGVKYAFHTIDGANWMPVTWISYMLDTSLYGIKPAGYHLTNIILHAASVGFLFLGLQRMTKLLWPAAAIAAIFAFHPQRLESVVWVAERKDVLSVCFWMLGLLAYARYAEQPGPRRMIWVVACLLLGLLAKPIVISFPFVLLLLDLWPLQRAGSSPAELRTRIWPLIREKIPLFLVCMVIASITIWAQGAKGGILHVQSPWHQKMLQVFQNVGFYCQTFFAPTGLAIIYRVVKPEYLYAGGVGLGLLAVSAVSLWRAWRWPWLAVGWFWFLFTIAPVAGIIHLEDISVADRYSYLPCVGLAMAVVFSLRQAVELWPRLSFGLTGALAAGILFCALGTWADFPRWRNTFTIFESAYRNGAHFIACDQFGSQLYTLGQFQAAIVVCNRGLEDNPNFASLYNTRGGSYLALGDLDRALPDFDRSIELSPTFSAAYFCRATLYARRKEFAKARADIEAYHKAGGTMDASQLNIPPP